MGAELIALFEESVLEVHHLPRGGRFTVGESASADLSYAGLGEARELVRVGSAGIELVHADEVDVELLDREAVLSWTRELLHERSVALLPDGARARLTFGALTLLVAAAPLPRRAALEPTLELRDHVATVGAAIVALLCLLMLSAIPPDAPSLSIDDELLRTRAARFVVTAPELPKPPAVSTGASGAAGGASRTRAPARRALAPTTKPGTPRKAGDPRAAREAAELAASKAGILGIVREYAHTGSLFGASSALGAGGDAAFGELNGTTGCGGCGASETWLSGSLVTNGTGGRGDTIASGPIGPASKSGPPGGASIALKRSLASIDPAPPTVKINEGPYDRAIIRRVVRAHMREYQFCYERELQRDASLSGRVVPRFTIEPTGRVVVAMLESSTIGSAAVDACVVATTKRLEFPKADRPGLTIVSYPFVFKTAAQN